MCYLGKLRLRRICWSAMAKKNRISVACDDVFKYWFMAEQGLSTWESELFHRWIAVQVRKGLMSNRAPGIN